MRKNFLKCILNLFLVFTTIITLFSCNSNEIKPENLDINSDNSTTPTNSTSFNGDNIMDYKIQEIDGEYYIVFDDISKYIVYDDPYLFDEPITWITFDNVEQMQDAILNGKLEHYQKEIMANYFHKNDNGIIISNPYKVCSPIFPDETIKKYSDLITVSWGGYSFEVHFSDNSDAKISFICLNKKDYNDTLESTKNNIPYPYEKSDNEFDEIVGEKEVFESIDGKIIQYTFSKEDKAMYVVEEQDFRNSNCTFYEAKAFYESNGAYFQVIISHMTEPIDPEWLFEFDVEKYVPTEKS